MLLSWIAFPVIAGLVCLALGLLVDRAARSSLPPALLLPAGGAALICLTQVTTAVSATAPATVPIVVGMGVAGLVVGRERIATLKETVPAVRAAVGVFVVVSLPVLATGTPSFAGYTVLGDTAVHLAGAQELPSRGRDAGSLEPSNYASSFRAYYVENAYPSGGATALGSLARLTGQDPAWVFQPFLSFLLGLLALALFALVAPYTRSHGIAGLVAFCAAQPALLTAFAMQGSLKEIAVAAMLATLAAAIASAVDRHAGPREVVPLAVAAAATVGVFGPAAVVWVAPLLLGAVVLAYRAGRSARSLVAPAAVALAVALVLASQTLVVLDTASSVATSVASVGEVGNLLRPLAVDQALGVWLTGDYRVPPVGAALWGTRILEVAIVVLGALGIAWCLSRRAWGPLLYAGAVLLGGAFVLLRGSVWADAKALAVMCPAVVLLALLGATGHLQRHRVVAGVGVAAIVTGVLASSAFIYRSASIAPYDRLAELSAIGQRVDGSGPVLIAEFDDFAPYFLRKAQPEPAPLLIASPGDASLTARAAATDLDGMTAVDAERYPFLVTRKGPIGSRPSSAYKRAFRTKHFTVWKRDGTQPVVARLPLGASARNPTGLASCSAVRQLAEQAGVDGALVFPEPQAVVVVDPFRADLPAGWRRDPDDPRLVLPSGGGQAGGKVEITTPGRYTVWLEGSFGRTTAVDIDGVQVGSVRNRLGGRRVAENLGTVVLSAGSHSVRVKRTAAGLAPGAGGLFRHIGPVYLVRDGDVGLRSVPAPRWRSLCDRRLDWIEAVA